jgi:hypothetical protein
MTDLRGLEYDSLRATIRLRTTLAPALLVATFLGWATLTLWVFTSDVVSAATLVPLMLLAAGFEAISLLSSSADRLARYLQVAYEEPIVTANDAPRWETIALSYRQRFAPSGSNGLFATLFLLATVVNYLPAAVSGTVEELTGLGVAHVLFAIRIVIAVRIAARRLREDVDRFRALLADRAATHTSNSAPSA